MALFTSQVYAEIRGSVNGITYARNRHGAYARSRVVPVNTNTARQVGIRSTMNTLQAAWRDTLTSAQRLAWNNFADGTPVLNKLGFSTKLTGINWYIAVNSLRLNAGQARDDSAPVTNGLAAFPTITLSGTTVIGLNIATVSPALAASEILQALTSPPKPFSVNFFGSGFVRTFYQVGVAAPPYLLIPSAQVAVGQRYFVKLRFHDAAGRPSSDFQFSFDITV